MSIIKLKKYCFGTWSQLLNRIQSFISIFYEKDRSEQISTALLTWPWQVFFSPESILRTRVDPIKRKSFKVGLIFSETEKKKIPLRILKYVSITKQGWISQKMIPKLLNKVVCQKTTSKFRCNPFTSFLVVMSNFTKSKL